MVFNSLIFLLFIALLLPTYWGLRSDRWRHPLLFAANFLFYGWWDWRFMSLLFGVMATTWAGGLWIAGALDHPRRNPRWALFWCCAVQLGVLGYFKYANFFSGSFQHALQTVGINPGWTTLNIILPAGISFYIFQAISYLASIYQEKLTVEKNFVKLGVYLGFFPHLVAGPIIRAHYFLPQLAAPRIFDGALFFAGCRKFVVGLLYKAVFADNLAAAVNPIYSSPASQSGSAIFGACLGFYGQSYFDFAGYSLMAIGVANLLGYTLPDNFSFPYGAASLVDFWRRWHISLSTWLRDYVYIPLGGNRHGVPRQYGNLMATMFLGGLWHGANWNFVLWGGLHGLGLCVNHLWSANKLRFLARDWTNSTAARAAGLAASWILVQFVVFLCLVPFRAQSYADTGIIFQGLLAFFTGHGGAANGFPWLLATVPLIVDTFIVSSRERAASGLIRNPVLATLVFSVSLLVIFLFMRSERVPFIYFQF